MEKSPSLCIDRCIQLFIALLKMDKSFWLWSFHVSEFMQSNTVLSIPSRVPSCHSYILYLEIQFFLIEHILLVNGSSKISLFHYFKIIILDKSSKKSCFLVWGWNTVLNICKEMRQLMTIGKIIKLLVLQTVML
jgi:hypothetical protein